jgi:hypothetical protein
MFTLLCQRTNQDVSPSVTPLHHHQTATSTRIYFQHTSEFIYWWEIQTYWVNTFLIRWQWVCVADVNAKCVYSIMKLY